MILTPPSGAHLFGTDNFGRDLFSRVIWAARVDLQIAIFTTIFPFFFGSLLGAVVGYYGKWADAVFGRVVDVIVVFPFLVLVIGFQTRASSAFSGVKSCWSPGTSSSA